MLVTVFSASAYTSALFSCSLDFTIKRYQKQYMPMIEPDWFKSQFYQESLLKHDAVSPVGAMGVAQVMPGTFEDIRRDLGWDKGASPFVPSFSIEAGIYYDRKMWNVWKSPRTFESRLKLMFASYNAGAGNLIKAQKLSGGMIEYDPIIAYLPDVTGKHSKETITYVDRIFRWKQQLEERRPCL